jgi:hypothetical protein
VSDATSHRQATDAAVSDGSHVSDVVPAHFAAAVDRSHPYLHLLALLDLLCTLGTSLLVWPRPEAAQLSLTPYSTRQPGSASQP